jgi:dTMP kinase
MADVDGRLIAVEGLDGSGKSTQVYLLKRWLELGGYRCFFTEWNSSLIVKQATKKGKKRNLLTPTTFSLIHATDFADRYERQILPMLQAGYLVLADRYIYTAFARDVARGCDPKWVRKLYGFARPPDITAYFSLPAEVAFNRITESRPQLKYHEAGMDLGLSADPYESFRLFQERIDSAYREMADEFGFITIDATRAVEQQQEEFRRIVAQTIDLPHYRRQAIRAL